MIENMRRLSTQIVAAQRVRLLADLAVDSSFAGDAVPMAKTETLVAGLNDTDAPHIYCAQIAKRLRGADPSEIPLMGWLQERLQTTNSSID